MKAIFIFPPQWDIFSQSTGIPVLMGVLEKEGIQCIAHDLNIDFFHYILSYAKIQESLIKAEKISENKDNQYSKEKSEYIKKKLSTYNKNIFLQKLIKNIDNILNLYKSKENYFNHERRIVYDELINKGLEIFSLQYYPYVITQKSCETLSCTTNHSRYNLAARISENQEENMFFQFFNEKISSLDIENGDLICISILSDDQLLSALTLIKMIRKKYNVKIALGGTWAEQINSEHNIYANLFEQYIDYCMTGLGENVIKELWEHHLGKRRIEDVFNLIYYKDNKIIKNPQNNLLQTQICKYSYNGYDFSKYFAIDTVLPIRVSYGCYWGKCTFCNYNINKTYFPKSVDDVINEIKELQNKYKIKYFYFQDAALSPAFLNEFSDKIIKQKINIRYITNLRFEKEFNKDFLKKLFKSGLRYAQWGLESASNKILKK